MAIVESLRKVVDFVKGGFVDDDPFDEIMDEEGGEYVEPGSNAVRAINYEPVTEPIRESKVVRDPRFNHGGNEIVVIEPHSFDDVASIVDKLKDRKIVMLDMHLLDNHQSQRTIDYICGASQALGGQPKRVGDRVFVFAPNNVTLSADTPAVQNKYDTAWRTNLQ